MKYILFLVCSILVLSCSDRDVSKISDYYENGSKKVVDVIKGNQISSKIFYDINGNMLSREEYYLGKLYGVWEGFDPTSELKVNFFGNGNKRTEGRFVNGKLDGRRSFYTRDGHLDKEKYFSNGIETGCWIQYKHDGSKTVKLMHDYGLVKDNGNWTEFYNNGRVKKITGYSNNRRNGSYVEYFHDGEVKLEGEYIKGKKNNKWIEYSPDGYIKKIENYSNGILNGLWKSFHSESLIKVIGEYKNNYRVGTWKWLNNDGDLIHSRQF